MSTMSELDMAVEDLASVVLENTIEWLSDGEPIPDMVAFVAIEAVQCAFEHDPNDLPYVIGHAISLVLSQMQTLNEDIHTPHVVH